MRPEKYLSTTWYDPRMESRTSRIQGNGMFAASPISKGETVIIIGGTVLTDAEFQAITAMTPTYNAVQIGEDAHLIDLPTAPGGVNHSCDSNLWMSDEVTVVARRDIAVEEELTIDYALFTVTSWTLDQSCHCGSSGCRHVVTGNDWQRQDVQERYHEHFSPFINERIRRQSKYL